jgi:DUF4097 and DUF4098 domain-containing protein YvlB
MVRSTVIGLVVVLLVVKAVSSLNWIASHWEERTDTIKLESHGIKDFELTTTNGTVEFAGQDDHLTTTELVAHVKAGANSAERAQHALDAIEVTTEGKDTENCRIGWRWRDPQESDWSAVVDFTLRAPKGVNLKIESHNGLVTVKKLAGNAKITTHNGKIDTESSGESLDAETANGQIKSKFSGHKVNLHSSNGRIAADLSDAHAVEGEIATHNGIVEVTVGKQTSCELVTKTGHGYRNSPGGKIGQGGGKLVATSRNGAVLIHNGPPGHGEVSDKDEISDNDDEEE